MNHSLATDMPASLTLAQLSALDGEDFVAAVGAVFEHSPWVMRRAWALRPFADRAALTAALNTAAIAALKSHASPSVRVAAVVALRCLRIPDWAKH